MKIAESWLRSWADPDLDTAELAHQLTMLGHEVDGVETSGAGLDGVMIGEILGVEKHPDADRLSVCRVSTGTETVEIVCGAPNVRQGMKSPLAMPGVTLPNGVKLKKSKIRGVVSNGMLCSAVELGLGEDSSGIMDLPGDAPVGDAFAGYLGLPDAVIEVDLTPNRGDCFSVLGIARDVAALTGAELKSTHIEPVAATIDDTHDVIIDDPRVCPSFTGRVIRGIDPRARSPLWMTERLRRAGLRPIHPVVDVTNYVMLELGQPCHAYDRDLVKGPIRPRLAKSGESVILLDEKAVRLNADTVAIADDSGVIGLAGIMGGLSTAVSESTNNIFFEAAFWPQAVMAGKARSYGLHTDASLRFERGVDPTGQLRAVEFATALIIDICGGEAGPTKLERFDEYMPARPPIALRRSRLEKLLGASIDDATVEKILTGLELDLASTESGWTATPPEHRFDLSMEVDLIEEVARMHGYDSIPETTGIASTALAPATESMIGADLIAAMLVARDYQEVITYSFIDAEQDASFSGDASTLVLSNPISSEMSVMRASLLPGLAASAASNLARQQERVRLFEIGKSFHGDLSTPEETERVAAIIIGPRDPEQWSVRAEGVDFFDIKSDVEALLEITGRAHAFEFRACEHPALQPGQASELVHDGDVTGIVGKLHPRVARLVGLKPSAYVFELDAKRCFASQAPAAKPVSRFPGIRRDIAVVVDQSVPAAELVRCVKDSSQALIRSVRIFDIYTGKGVEAGLKSVALGLILQETSRTLTDEDADSATARAVQKLQQEYAAELRE